MNVNAPASVLWHDALDANVKAIDPRHQIGFATKDRGLDEMADHVLAGYIQYAIDKLPDHLREWGHLCWAPPTNCPPGLFDRTHARLRERWDGMPERRRIRYAARIDRVIDIAIVKMVHQARTRTTMPYSQAAYSRHLGIDRSNYRREGYADLVAEFMQVMSDWTDQALRPIIEIRAGQLQTDT